MKTPIEWPCILYVLACLSVPVIVILSLLHKV